jgi:hypothetical protein
MLCNVGHLHWQAADGDGDAPPVRDAAAVCCALDAAAAQADLAERTFRGEAWSNPAALHMEVLEAARVFAQRGCDVGRVEQAARGAVRRLATRPPRSVAMGGDAPPCWSDALQARFVAIEGM